MYHAARAGRFDIVKYLESLGYKNYIDGMIGAVRSKNSKSMEMVEYFYNKVPKSVSMDAFAEAIYYKREEIIKFFIKKGLKYNDAYKLSLEM